MPKIDKKSTTPVLTAREEAGLAKIRLRPVVKLPPLTESQVKLVEYGYPESVVRNMADPDWVAKSLRYNVPERGSPLVNWERPAPEPKPEKPMKQREPLPVEEPAGSGGWNLADE